MPRSEKIPNAIQNRTYSSLPQKGKEKNSITSYRPISLLPILGKFLEKLLFQRVNFTRNKQNVLHLHQFGFREGKSTNHALRKFLDVIEDAKEREHYVMVISLDIQGAFDNLKYEIIRKELRKLFTKSNISETLEDILSNRKVAIQSSDGPAVWKQKQGCPQGSCTSPLFWNIVADEILKTDWPKKFIYMYSPTIAPLSSVGELSENWNSTQVSPSKLLRIGLTKINLIFQ
ncbi:hypothetical protein AVEN_110802-1 [Araneus ventricosus]|uniref:Reverse transcriptase domain-containing protein n=1 Tax=Araneus ventricosus TaxID=182803 RepID=A0A4Y2GEZ0_ARAVE|nr:hypothetical protein AVEN_110802-1 [Araneus ventricosus]